MEWRLELKGPSKGPSSLQEFGLQARLGETQRLVDQRTIPRSSALRITDTLVMDF